MERGTGIGWHGGVRYDISCGMVRATINCDMDVTQCLESTDVASIATRTNRDISNILCVPCVLAVYVQFNTSQRALRVLNPMHDRGGRSQYIGPTL